MLRNVLIASTGLSFCLRGFEPIAVASLLWPINYYLEDVFLY